MMLTNQFPELFREEVYAVNLALMDNRELDNPFDSVLRSRTQAGLWTKEYSVVPIGELGGRKEADPIPTKNMVMGYQCFGAMCIEASGKINLSQELKNRSREFVTPEGVDEPRFAGHLADSAARGFISRWAMKQHRLSANIFNLGGIQAGDPFFNNRLRTNGNSDLPNSNLIYDGRPLFALPSAPHPSYAAGALAGGHSNPVGTSVDMAGTIADTGGYFNAFLLPPSYWALKRVWTHYVYNMQYDENDVQYFAIPDTLLVSSYNLMRWTEVLESKFIEPRAAFRQSNMENVFMMEGFSLTLKHSPLLAANTWYLGRTSGPGIEVLDPANAEDPWAYYRDEDNRSYFISYEQMWGFLVRNWRTWVAGACTLDGTTPPTFNGVAEADWDIIPVGV